MTDDIVTRLRVQTIGCDDYNCESCEIETEAADEIERLRADRDRWNNVAAIAVQALLDGVEGEVFELYELALKGKDFSNE